MTEGLELKLFEDGAAGVVDYSGTQAVVEIPREFEGRPVRYIAGDAFCGASVTRMLLPSTVQLIGDYPGYSPWEEPVACSGLAGQPVEFICEMGCGATRRLLEIPSFQVELVDHLAEWIRQNPEKAL